MELVNIDALRALVLEVVLEVLKQHEAGGEWMTAAEAAVVASVAATTIREWVKVGRLRAVRVGRNNIRIARADLDEAITSWSRAPRGGKPESIEARARREALASLGKAPRR